MIARHLSLSFLVYIEAGSQFRVKQTSLCVVPSGSAGTHDRPHKQSTRGSQRATRLLNKLPSLLPTQLTSAFGLTRRLFLSLPEYVDLKERMLAASLSRPANGSVGQLAANNGYGPDISGRCGLGGSCFRNQTILFPKGGPKMKRFKADRHLPLPLHFSSSKVASSASSQS
jgi:hypothetical protein